MKKLIFLFVFSIVTFSYYSCKEVEDILTCDNGLRGVKLEHSTPDSTNLKLVNIEFLYDDDNGEYIGEVMWDFGDGKNEVTQGFFVSHEYDTTGTYRVKAMSSIHINSERSCVAVIETVFDVP